MLRNVWPPLPVPMWAYLMEETQKPPLWSFVIVLVRVHVVTASLTFLTFEVTIVLAKLKGESLV